MIGVNLAVLAGAGAASFALIAWMDRRRVQPGPDVGLDVLDDGDGRNRMRLLRGMAVDRAWLNRRFGDIAADAPELSTSCVQRLEALYLVPGRWPG